MSGGNQPFIGGEALATKALTRYELRRYYRPIMPNVHVNKWAEPSLHDRIRGAWLWSGRQATVAGMAASALHGSMWVDEKSSVELIWPNARAPEGVVTRHDLLLDDEVHTLDDLPVTTPERTAFDIGRRGRLDAAVARLDALARATDFKVTDVEELVRRHRRARGLRRLEAALDLVDAGAQSPKETWLRLLLIRAGFPKPRTQIPVVSADGYRQYYLDMGWEDIMLAVEYDGDQHRTDPAIFAYDIQRAEDLDELGWTRIRVVAQNRAVDVVARVRRARGARAR